MFSQEQIEDIYTQLQPYCKAIYFGGSRVDKYIENPHDYDYICVGHNEEDCKEIRMKLHKILNTTFQNVVGLDDFIQVRNAEQEEHAYGSYINKMMIKIVGEDVEFTFDVINKDRTEYYYILREADTALFDNRIKNKKRYYQLLRGIFILQNNSYDLTEEQAKIVNEVHDQKPGCEKYYPMVREYLDSVWNEYIKRLIKEE